MLAPKVVARKHRLIDQAYTGQMAVVFTSCTDRRAPLFLDASIVDRCVELLSGSLSGQHCIAPIYCFMPDHLHVVIQGTAPNSDPKRAFIVFKQKSGYMLKHTAPYVGWQKSFYDHIIGLSDDYEEQLNYILANPARRELCVDPCTYHGIGCIGTSFKEVFRL